MTYDTAESSPAVQLAPTAESCDPHPALSFASEEEAAAFLREEEKDEALERSIPLTQLAADFYRELATTANEELEAGASSESVPLLSQKERREEAKKHHLAFFIAFYQSQGMLPPTTDEASTAQIAREVEERLTRPLPWATLRVHASFPLSRLVTRHQLEKCGKGVRGAAAFIHTADSLLYQVMLEQPTTAPCRFTESADRLQAFLCNGEGEENAVVGTGEASMAPAVHPVPPSADQLRWLQRQVASEAVLLWDRFSSVLSSLAVWLLSRVQLPSAPSCASLLCLHSLGAVWEYGDEKVAAEPAEGSDSMLELHKDIALRLEEELSHTEAFANTAVEAACWSAEAITCQAWKQKLREATVVVRLPTRSGARSRATEGEFHRKGSLSASDCAPNLAFIVPKKRAALTRSSPCRSSIVLCTPPTSGDGIRVRSKMLGVSDSSDRKPHRSEEVLAVEEDEEVPHVMHRYIDVSTAVNRFYFSRLQTSLRSAIEDIADEGYVIYATRSLNPLENEAVVCSVLTEYLRRRCLTPRAMDRDESVHAAEEEAPEPPVVVNIECVSPIESGNECLVRFSPSFASLRSLWNDPCMGTGLTEWSAFEEGPQEAAWNDAETRANVATAARRARFSCSQSEPTEGSATTVDDDFWFCVVLRVQKRVRSPPPSTASVPTHAQTRTTEAESLQLLVGGEPMKPRGSTTCASSDGTASTASSFSQPLTLCTTALFNWLTAQCMDVPAEKSEGWKVFAAGMPVGVGLQTGTPAAPAGGPRVFQNVKLLSSLSGSTWSRALRDLWQAALPQTEWSTIRVRPWLLAELLQRRKIDASALHACAKKIKEKAYKNACIAAAAAHADVEALVNQLDARAQLAAEADQLNESGASPLRLHCALFLQPHVATLDPNMDEPPMKLAPQVTAELKEVVVIGSLGVSSRSTTCGKREWCLLLIDEGTLPPCGRKQASVNPVSRSAGWWVDRKRGTISSRFDAEQRQMNEEMRVRLRDALIYISRCLGGHDACSRL